MTAPKHDLLSFAGRLSASDYRHVQRQTGLTLLGGLVLCTLSSALLIQAGTGGWAGLPLVPLVIALVVTNAALQIRRLHDLGLSGWWTLPMFSGPIIVVTAAVMLKDHLASMAQTTLAAAPLLVVLGLLVWASQALRFVKGQRTENRFGPLPQI